MNQRVHYFQRRIASVFTNQMADSILLTVDGMKNNQAGFGGFRLLVMKEIAR